ncbi:uncharacterized protein LOC103940603 isoform X2 [Pyrus x bretschneideri]|uniref:uncharacterized protein LOC103940603 isoform X2 n=1 Tax=Pyrus x bretschneideri TaxID=225117 RepID=UPI00202F5083|nr:uncharacterized protein LOC103940603 isoform X2 [Pyrus x bretschneideri]
MGADSLSGGSADNSDSVVRKNQFRGVLFKYGPKPIQVAFKTGYCTLHAHKCCLLPERSVLPFFRSWIKSLVVVMARFFRDMGKMRVSETGVSSSRPTTMIGHCPNGGSGNPKR